jgi:hypothetical protein
MALSQVTDARGTFPNTGARERVLRRGSVREDPRRLIALVRALR